MDSGAILRNPLILAVSSICLLASLMTSEALAASGSTRLTIHLDQSAVDAIVRWRGEAARLPLGQSVAQGAGALEQLLPAARSALSTGLDLLSVERVLRELSQDTLLIFEHTAVQAGRSSGHCLAATPAKGVLTVHSI